MISLSGGETCKVYRVMEGDRQLGVLDMTELLPALVPARTGKRAMG